MPLELHQKLKKHSLYALFKITCSWFWSALVEEHFQAFFPLYLGEKKKTKLQNLKDMYRLFNCEQIT